MRNLVDILLVMKERETFTSDDIASDLEMSRAGANNILVTLSKYKMIESVKVGKSFVYCLTPKGLGKVDGFTPLDPQERTLLLEYPPYEADMPECVHEEHNYRVTQWYERGVGYHTVHTCCNCLTDLGHSIIPVDDRDIPF